MIAAAGGLLNSGVCFSVTVIKQYGITNISFSIWIIYPHSGNKKTHKKSFLRWPLSGCKPCHVWR
ncbi:hypothetical protein B7802_25340 [Salmonella enterica]|nr:hypothetical protein [Salmonella enterica subsp. diarizonae]EAP0946293.1 hypothetical protein [Salmonella enterica]EBI4325061.1 hypothetical protein [Salmonella enterica]ECE6216851.1 hypothetical protein [Salmonella enterica subsp. diarizonae]ECG0670908.1 hypothetical protein [Salmonella enterica subsp. diarizonae]